MGEVTSELHNTRDTMGLFDHCYAHFASPPAGSGPLAQVSAASRQCRLPGMPIRGLTPAASRPIDAISRFGVHQLVFEHACFGLIFDQTAPTAGGVCCGLRQSPPCARFDTGYGRAAQLFCFVQVGA